MASTDLTTAYLELCDIVYDTWKNSITSYTAKTTPYWATFFK